MQNDHLTGRVTEVAEPLCEDEGFELVHVEIASVNRETIVRLFLDKPGGITLDDCVQVSRELGDLMEVQIPTLGKYRLEVSSPGPKRPLKKKDDFKRFAGHRIRVETRDPIEGQKKFTGVLEKINDDSVEIAVDGKRITIPDLSIENARLAGQ
ncbi:MAG: ribosome maturation factor RimP [Desulfobacterales bacterium]|nr:ribosome maturation factor RimP [Desulfobacterales bacterium]